MLTSMRNKSVVVTGGTKGIGRGIAKVFAELGARVCIIGRTDSDGIAAERALGQALGQNGGTVKFHRADMRKQADLEKATAAVASAFGGIDVLCANAGILPQARLEQMRRVRPRDDVRR
jgi:3-oxoacyl-[acyl-carrier protein] reductase